VSITRLSWGLAVATYERQDLLVRCVRQALVQTRPPSEVVIVDSSRGFDENRAAVEAVVAELSPGLRLVFERALRPQQTVQRNQAVALARADVLFMIDDDSLLYPTCAERILEVYERAGAEQVVAVMAELHPTPPDRVAVESEVAEPPRLYFGIASRISAFLKGDFYPPFATLPAFPTPEFGPGARWIDTLHGARITVRRAIALAEPFDEALVFNAHEDRDAGFRFRRHGVLAVVSDPLICHAEAVRTDAAPRRGFAYRGAWLLNYAYLVTKWCPGDPKVRPYVERFARSMVLLDLASAARTRQFARAAGVLYVKQRLLPKLFAARPEDLSRVMVGLSEDVRVASNRPLRELALSRS